MIDFKYLELGITGLANAHLAGTMAGHLGAAVAAGYFIGEDRADMPEQVYKGIEGELKRIIAGEEAIWFNAKKTGLTPTALFKKLPREQPNPKLIHTLAEALSKNASRTRQSGHNIIFASIAIRALHDHPEFASPKVVIGIRKLIEGFNNVHAGRGYFGKNKGWLTEKQIKLNPDTDFEKYNSIQNMVDVTIEELINTAAKRKQGFGGLWHIINHAAAIAELQRFGYEPLAKQALPAHHQHMRLRRALPDVESELGPVKKSPHNPHQAVYWDGMLKRDEARLTHRIKTIYGFYTLSHFIKRDNVRKQANEAFLYLMD